MWEPRRLTPLWAFTASYKDNFTLLLTVSDFLFAYFCAQLHFNLTTSYVQLSDGVSVSFIVNLCPAEDSIKLIFMECIYCRVYAELWRT
jgi:hypothetical protein